MSVIARHIRKLVREDAGNVGVIFALTAIPVFGMVGLAVDYGRAVTARSQIQSATDAAALAAVRLTSGSEQDRILAAQRTFSSNYSRYSGAGTFAPSVTVDGSSVTVQATDTVPAPFAGLLGFNEFTINAQSDAAMVSGKHLELSMMIDLTGSMGATRNGQTKIAGLKEAAGDLMEILFPNGATSSDAVRVAVAPFADYVNAGEWAAAATGLPATGGTYSNIANLASTRQGRFNGTYTGAVMNGAGSQHGVTPPTATYAGQTSAAGTTYSNSYCATPTMTTTASIRQYNGRNTGESVTRVDPDWGSPYNGAAPTGMLKANSTDRYYDINKYDYSWDFDDSSSSSGYYVPLVTSETGLEIQQRSAYAGHPVYATKTGNVGQAISVDHGTPTSPARRASTSPGGGYWHVKEINTDGTLDYEWKTSGYYLPMYTSLGGTSTVAGCESTVVAQPSSQLISCVTERTGGEAYTDASPATATVGRYNHGVTSVSNYSSDGSCWVSGRKLPSIIPLTSNRTTLDGFFDSATIGGATPGHIGTAWAWYMISPEWSSVFPASSTPTPYNTENVMKTAVLMTDGEYNIHYASPAARDQALALCDAMKAKGITVYTVGFGFAEGTVANASGTTEQRAKDLMQRCASSSSNYFFPYDGAQLRRDFQAIGAQLMGQMTSTQAKLLN